MVHRPVARALFASAVVLSGAAVAHAGKTAEPRAASASDRECLARAMYFESSKTAEDGMLAVGTVVANRLKSGRYGSSVCSVVGQRGQFAAGVMSRKMTGAPAERARQMAEAVLRGKRHPAAGDAMFFHTAGLKFRYPNMRYVLVSGGNAFYEKKSASTREAQAANAASMKQAYATAKTAEAAAKPIVSAALGAPAAAPVAPACFDAAPPPVTLAYRAAPRPPAGGALGAVAALKPKPGQRVISMSAPVLASAGPVAPAETPVQTLASTASMTANIVVAQAWDVVEWALR